MDIRDLITSYWKDVAEQNAMRLASYFRPDGIIRWRDTNECFTVDEFIRANCEYPGDWCGEVERFEILGVIVITVTKVWLKDDEASFHVVSFFEFEGEKIKTLDEYWGENSAAPQWRLDMKIGKAIF